MLSNVFRGSLGLTFGRLGATWVLFWRSRGVQMAPRNSETFFCILEPPIAFRGALAPFWKPTSSFSKTNILAKAKLLNKTSYIKNFLITSYNRILKPRIAIFVWFVRCFSRCPLRNVCFSYLGPSWCRIWAPKRTLRPSKTLILPREIYWCMISQRFRYTDAPERVLGLF